MGMAASQARYLALVARKSNCEYEGQQINQARTVLSNQSANLFNQMLALSVPVPPSTQDFTKKQYSYSDGLNASTIDSWQQLANPESEYNYVVTHHYYTDVYTGSEKKLSDPQVKMSGGTVGSNINDLAKAVTSAYAAYSVVEPEYQTSLDNYDAAVEANKKAQAELEIAKKTKAEAQAIYDEIVASMPAEPTDEQKRLAQLGLSNVNAYGIENEVNTTDKVVSSNTDKTQYTYGASTIYKKYDSAGLSDENKNKLTNSLEMLKENGAISSYDMGDIYITGTDPNYSFAFKDDLEACTKNPPASSFNNYALDLTSKEVDIKTAIETVNKYDSNSATKREAQLKLDTAVKMLQTAETNAALAQIEEDTQYALLNNIKENTNYDDLKTAYDKAVEDYNNAAKPESIGNCELTLLESLSKDQKAEIRQVVADMKKNGINANIINYYDDVTDSYTGGIYQFKLNGVTYYTCVDDLMDSYDSGTGINHIDSQQKLSYYNATYVSTKIEKTEKALVETDGNGRFTTVKFETDSMAYTLNMETITDDVAYQDAMNKYYYESNKYDKMIQDINAKTSIIQRQDQELELRLKQLDTEHNALQTEMEAVSSVVKKNVEQSFKTFGN